MCVLGDLLLLLLLSFSLLIKKDNGMQTREVIYIELFLFLLPPQGIFIYKEKVKMKKGLTPCMRI